LTVQELITKLGFETDEAKLKKFQAGLQKASKIARGVSIAVVGIGAAAVKAYATQEQAEKKLRAALDATGQGTDENFAAMKKYASELQKVTTVGDEASLGLMQIAINSGLTSEQAQQATKDAIGLSKGFNVDLKTAIKATTLAQQGNYEMLNRHIPAVKNATTESEKAAAAQIGLANGFKVAEAEMDTTEGKIKDAKNSFGDFLEILGKVLVNGLQPVIEGMQKLTDRMANIDPETAETLVKIGLALAAIYPIIKMIQGAMLIYNGIMKIATGIQWLYNAAVAANPTVWIILAIIAAITLLIAAGVAIYKNWDVIKEKAAMVWGKIKEGLATVRDFFVAVGTKIKNFMLMVWEGIKTGFSIAINFIKKIFFTFADYFLTVWGTIIKGVLGAASKVGSLIGIDTSKIDGMIDKVQGLQDTVRGQSFFGGGGGGASGVIPPQAMAAAGGGGTTNLNMNSQISVGVPAGTSADQAKFIEHDVRRVVRQENEKAARRSYRGAGRVE